jgi:hypothetical protein
MFTSYFLRGFMVTFLLSQMPSTSSRLISDLFSIYFYNFLPHCPWYSWLSFLLNTLSHFFSLTLDFFFYFVSFFSLPYQKTNIFLLSYWETLFLLFVSASLFLLVPFLRLLLCTPPSFSSSSSTSTSSSSSSFLLLLSHLLLLLLPLQPCWLRLFCSFTLSHTRQFSLGLVFHNT